MAKNMYQKREERKKNRLNNNVEQEKSVNSNINWYPGHMAKTKRLIRENINLIDVIYEVIDARIPRSSKIVDIDDIVRKKPRILIMTKYDLCDKVETDKFIKDYESKGYYILKYDLNTDTKELINLTNEILKEKNKRLMDKGMTAGNIRALVVGIPNVGKSTLINKITGRNAAKTGNKPGVTTNLNWIKVSNNIYLLDTPGILWPKLEQGDMAYNLAATTAIKEEILPLDDVFWYVINFLYKYYPNILKDNYNVTDVSDYDLVMEQIGRGKNLIMRGNMVDYVRVTKLVINDIKQGKIKGVTFDRFKK